MKRIGASAPGKALLCGEYAVLEGATAVVAAVDRRVMVTWTDELQPMPPEVQSTLELARKRCGAVQGALELDVSALQHDRIKLGLGSSAASAAATAAAVFATHGHDLADPAIRHRVFDCALRGHAAVAPQGSGVDVAASAFGGFLEFNRGSEGPSVEALRAPDGLSISLVWTGHAARTNELVGKVHELRRDDPPEYRRRIDELTDLASSFAGALRAGTAAEVVSCAAPYARAMGALGDAAGAPIIESRLRLALDLAARFSGSAKPCGAGGGDVAIAFFADPGAANAFELACEDEGLHPIDVSWGAEGVKAR